MGGRSNLLVSSLVLAIMGCASAPPPVAQPVPAAPATQPAPPAAQPKGVPRYVCDNNLAFTVHFGDGVAQVNAGPQGEHFLPRDAGGVTPQQTVYSSTKLKAEFGLDPDGRGAKLSFVSPALEARCVKE